MPEPSDSLPDFLRLFTDQAYAYALEHVGESDVKDAWDTFRVWLGPEMDERADDWRLFLAWYVFNWQSVSQTIPRRKNPVIAHAFLETLADSITPEQKNLVYSAVHSPLDFYEVYQLPEPSCLYVKSLFLGSQHSYAFDELPAGLGAGDIFFGKIVQLQADRGLLAAHSPPLPASAKVRIARFRMDLVRARQRDFSQNFSLFDSDVFNLYFDLRQEDTDG